MYPAEDTASPTTGDQASDVLTGFWYKHHQSLPTTLPGGRMDVQLKNLAIWWFFGVYFLVFPPSLSVCPCIHEHAFHDVKIVGLAHQAPCALGAEPKANGRVLQVDLAWGARSCGSYQECPACASVFSSGMMITHVPLTLPGSHTATHAHTQEMDGLS